MARRGFLAARLTEILCFVLLALAVATAPVRSQISTSILDTGNNKNISGAYAGIAGRRTLTVRSFPDGARNCYTVNTTAGTKYLVKAVFMYGNYDGVHTQPYLFELHLGVNLWTTINVTDPQQVLLPEVITVATADFMSVCLVNIGTGTPFISALELRPLKDIMYPVVNASRSLVSKFRFNMGSRQAYRYPDDPHDRFWVPVNNIPFWTEINTTNPVQFIDTDHFEAPSVVMQTAAVPVNSSKLQIYWPFEAGDINEYICILYFAEIIKLTGNMSRQFYVKINDLLWYDKPFTPQYLYNNYIYELNPSTGYLQYNISLEASGNSTLPPILNAMEVYTIMRNDSVLSDNGDVGAMMTIKAWYQIERNWNGDPCSPKAFAWDGLNCTYGVFSPPRVTTLNLTSSNLTGQVTGSFGNLYAIKYLDLSYNNLTGSIPDSLATLEALKVLDLRGNQLSGSIPSALLAKSQKGLITLRIEGNPNLCDNGSSCDVTSTSSTKKKISTPVVVIICIVAVVLLLVFLLMSYRVMKNSEGNGTSMKPRNSAVLNPLRGKQDDTLQLENKQFTYLELTKITNSFERELGQGGFGKVFYGCLEDGTQVAVKMRSNSSNQGNKEFFAEAQHLTRVHHKNLVSMIGYCKDGEYLGLVYEFMPLGTLQEQLRGITSTTSPLDWGQRLRIAVESAQGLEYLHKGCRPPLIHRDVKTANILLSEKLEAKIADFGLSRAFHTDADTRVSTAVMGTPGYVDPERFINNQSNEKSDVYSFGVVLLELITGRPAILPDSTNLVDWVRRRLARGSIEDVIDSRMQGRYDINSLWKCADVALECTAQSSQQRPTMSDVIVHLKESWELETANDTNKIAYTSSQHLHSEASDESRSNARVEIYHAARMFAASGPSAR